MAEAKITYRVPAPTVCPACRAEFHRETILTGGGRMNAGDLTDELHRQYLPTKKYGHVFPLFYSISVCPRCWFAAFPRHFTAMEDDIVTALHDTIDERKNLVRPLFDTIDFERDRTLAEGISSYVLAASCYDYSSKSVAPTFLGGLCFLRAGWLANDADEIEPNENYSYMARIFLRKASFYYAETLRCQNDKTEKIEEVPHHGPDTDKNYGFDGILYLTGLLQLKYAKDEISSNRIATLKESQTAVSRIVGIGEASKAKPSALLDLGRALHKAIKLELKTIDGA